MINSVTRIVGTALASLLLQSLPAAAQTTAADAAKPASFAGTWTLGLIGDHVIPTGLVLEQNGTALKGTYIFMGREFAFAGEVTGKSFSLKGTSPQLGFAPASHGGGASAPPQNAAQAAASFDVQKAKIIDTTIAGTMNDDGTMAGNMDVKLDEGRSGRIKWTAERLKARPTTSSSTAPTIDLNGDWKMNVVEAQLHMDVALKLEGSKVTGTAKSDHLGVMKLEGTYTNGALTFAATGGNTGADARIEFSGKAKADGTLAGDLKSQMGSMTWSAERVKK